MFYAARVGRWRGIFAHHSWIVVKERNGARYTRYDKVGWGRPVRTDGWPATGAGSATRRNLWRGSREKPPNASSQKSARPS
jgi:hypothetical protein